MDKKCTVLYYPTIAYLYSIIKIELRKWKKFTDYIG